MSISGVIPGLAFVMVPTNTHLLVLEEADLSRLHARRLLQVGPHGVDDVDVVHLVSCDAVGLAQLSAILNSLLWNGVDSLTLKRK